MTSNRRYLLRCLLILCATGGSVIADEPAAPAPDWSKEKAAAYLDERAQTWFEFSSADRGSGKDKITCISCHSVLPFALARPALRELTGIAEPTALETRLIEQTKRRVENWRELDSPRFRLFYDFSEQKKKESWGTEAVLDALVLALDERNSGRKEASTITRQALTNLWQAQIADGERAGSWEWLDFGLEPWESKRAGYFGAALAALAVGSAPGYYVPGKDMSIDKHVKLLSAYLRGQRASQNLNNRVWLLWASSRLDGLLSPDERVQEMGEILKTQQPDGGWSLSSLGTTSPMGFTPDAHSDGYATGLVLHVLQSAGIAKNDANLTRGLSWLRTHQEAGGGWRANSVNKKREPSTYPSQFMSHAATAYAVLALSH